MYIEALEEIEALEIEALAQASKSLELIYELSFDGILQESHIAMAYACLVGVGKDYEAKIVAKMAKLDDEVERSMLALWLLGARLELPDYREQWVEQARDRWCLMVVGSALQNIAMMDD